MRGSVIKRGSSYSIVYDIGRDQKGKRKQKWESGFKTKKDAEKALSRRIYEIQSDTYINPDKRTVKEYLNNCIETYVEKRLASTTIRGYKVNVNNHIIPNIGLIEINKLQAVHVQDLYNKLLDKGLSPTTVIYVHRVLRKAIGQAVKLQLISRNVCNLVELPKKKRYEAKVYNEKQVKELIEIAKDSIIYIPVLLAVGLGLRRGEALGLQWKDIDFRNKTAAVCRSLLPSDNGLILHNTKTEKSNRVITMPEFVINELKKHKENQEKYKQLLSEAYKDNDLITCYEDGKPYHPGTFSHLFSNILKRSKLEHIRFHDLRHTNATLMLKRNIPAKVASERLGHSNIGITMDLYSHVLKEMQEDAAIKLNNIF